MLTRVVPRCSGSGGAACSADGADGRPTPAADEILRQAHATSLAGILSQIGAVELFVETPQRLNADTFDAMLAASVAEYSLEIFCELKDESARLNDHFQRVRERVAVVALINQAADEGKQALRDQLIATELPSREESDRVLRTPEISFDQVERHQALVRVYNKCEAMPALEQVRT